MLTYRWAMASFRSAFLEGARESVPVLLAAAPFGLLFGALAIDNGLTVGEAVLMSAAIYAGASQMVGIELFGAHVAPWLIVFSIFAVNFRHVLYSASIGPQIAAIGGWRKWPAFFMLIDPQFAATEMRKEKKLPVTPGWYFGLGLPIYAAWVMEAWIGALFGRMIPDPQALGIDFLLPIYFLGLLLGFRKRTNWLPVVLAASLGSIAAFYVIGSPWHVSVGSLVGIFVAVLLPLPPKAAEEVAA